MYYICSVYLLTPFSCYIKSKISENRYGYKKKLHIFEHVDILNNRVNSSKNDPAVSSAEEKCRNVSLHIQIYLML